MDEQAIDVQTFLSNLEIEIPQLSRKSKLKGFKQIKNFIDSEAEFWNTLFEVIKSKDEKRSENINDIRIHFKEINDSISRFDSDIQNSALDIQAVANQWNGIDRQIKVDRTKNRNIILYSQMAESRLLEELYNENVQQGEGAYHYFNGSFFFAYRPRVAREDISEYEFRNYLLGFMKAYEIDHQNEFDITKRKKLQEKAYNELCIDIKNTLTDLNAKSQKHLTKIGTSKEELDTWKKEYKKDGDDWLNKSKEEWSSFLTKTKEEKENLKKTYTSFLEFEGPTEYWTKRAEHYREEGKMWLKFLSGSVAVAMAVILLLLYNLPEVLKSNLFNGEPGSIKGLLLVAGLVSFFFYLVRVFSKLTFSSFHIERDSKEREQLTMVYLALKTNNNITDGERDIIIQSLFSRVETGLLGSDSSPSMPGLQTIIEKLAK